MINNKRILIVDDDVKTVDLVKLYLNRDGYKVLTAYNGTDALKLARTGKPDLIVLDLMLPGIDGIELCQTLRQESEVPIIMLTAKTTEEDRLLGLETGADDYVTKPFSPRELAARVRAVLRRMPEESIMRGTEEIKYGELVINLPKYETYLNGTPLNLTNIEFKLLGIMAREPGRVFSRAQLIDKVMGYDFEGFDRSIDVHVHNLRKKLETNPDKPKYIKTVYGAGYKFIAGDR
jgi:two-component system, OmpR family, alkaline phosphatase synthesis response regulator PhoP